MEQKGELISTIFYDKLQSFDFSQVKGAMD